MSDNKNWWKEIVFFSSTIIGFSGVGISIFNIDLNSKNSEFEPPESELMRTVVRDELSSLRDEVARLRWQTTQRANEVPVNQGAGRSSSQESQPVERNYSRTTPITYSSHSENGSQQTTSSTHFRIAAELWTEGATDSSSSDWLILRNRELQSAFDHCWTAIGNDTNNMEARTLLAFIRLQKDQHADAAKELKAITPRDSYLSLLLNGLESYNTHDFSVAEHWLRESLNELDSNVDQSAIRDAGAICRGVIIALIGDTICQQGNVHSGIEWYKHAIAVCKANGRPSHYAGLRRLLYHQNK